MKCKICGDPGIAKDFCPKHYARWKKHGDPSVTMSHHEIGRLGANVRNAPGYWYHWLIRSVCTSCSNESPDTTRSAK